MAGALSGGGDDDSDLQDYMLMQSMHQPTAPAPRGALSSMDTNGVQAGTPQEWRDLTLLEQARGLVTAPHTGSISEGLGNAISNMAGVQSEHMKANQSLNAKLAEIQLNKDAALRQTQEQVLGREDVAKIMAAKNAQTPLSQDDIKAAGLAPGTVATKNAFGKISVVQSPPASQRMLTGYDDKGNATYADPGAALTPKLRSDYQEYLRQANQASPHLDNMLKTLSDPSNQSALGVSGAAERGLRATVGQAANAAGYTDTIAPKDATLRENMEQLNALLRPTLLADPRAQSAHLSPKEIEDMLPDPHGLGTSVDDAMTKYKSIQSHLKDRTDEYSSVLKGQQNITGGSGSGASLPTLPKPGELDSGSILSHAKDAISRGADPAAVKKRLKDMGVDASGLE